MSISFKTPSTKPSNYASLIILSALSLSIVLHGFLVLWVPEESNIIQSGNASRINVSMRQAALEKPNTASVNDLEKVKEVENKSEKQVLEPSPKKSMQEVKSLKLKPEVISNEPAIQSKPIVASIDNVQPQAHKTARHVSSKPDQQRLPLSEPNENNVEELNEKQVNNKRNNLTSHTNVKSSPQIARYHLGSNDNPIPEYPFIARKRGWQGEVVLGVYVRPDGSIENLTFVKSTNYGVLNNEAYETVRTSWKFKEMLADQEFDKTMYIEIPLTFGLAKR